jgi:hypothetical protein
MYIFLTYHIESGQVSTTDSPHCAYNNTLMIEVNFQNHSQPRVVIKMQLHTLLLFKSVPKRYWQSIVSS